MSAVTFQKREKAKCDIKTPSLLPCDRHVTWLVAGRVKCCSDHLVYACIDEIVGTDNGQVTVEYYHD